MSWMEFDLGLNWLEEHEITGQGFELIYYWKSDWTPYVLNVKNNVVFMFPPNWVLG